jgi:hypothetical protein
LGGTGISTTGSGNTITINNTFNMAYKAISVTDSPYTVLDTDDFISVDASGGAVTVRLPNSTTVGREIVIKDRTGSAATNNITVTTVGGAVTIDGQITYVFTDPYESIDLMFGSSVYQTF